MIRGCDPKALISMPALWPRPPKGYGPGHLRVKGFRYGANVDFWLGAMGQIPILAMGQTLKIIRIFNHNGRYEG